ARVHGGAGGGRSARQRPHVGGGVGRGVGHRHGLAGEHHRGSSGKVGLGGGRSGRRAVVERQLAQVEAVAAQGRGRGGLHPNN
nr:hypothetical protein [Tanacetum cinerariifolium]